MIIGLRMTQTVVEIYQGKVYKGVVFEDAAGCIDRELFPVNDNIAGLVDWVLITYRFLGHTVTNDVTEDGVRSIYFGDYGSFYIMLNVIASEMAQ